MELSRTLTPLMFLSDLYLLTPMFPSLIFLLLATF